MDDDQIYMRGGTEYDVEAYARTNGANLCEGCEGTGGVSVSAHQRGGEIIDEEIDVCSLCKGTGVITN